MTKPNERIVKVFKALCDSLNNLPLDEKISTINAIKLSLHAVSPMQREPVDCVLWVQADSVSANDYNPNTVAPPEMKLLEHSIQSDGYTQPIVTWGTGSNTYETVDGFHRGRVGKESPEVRTRVFGYLPITVINTERSGRNDRIAATIRHNRARGKHKVDSMSDIVIELKRRNWTDDKISRELGMDTDEILRLTQITGLIELFQDKDFSMSWDLGTADESDISLDNLEPE